jgi:hypothetical protein
VPKSMNNREGIRRLWKEKGCFYFAQFDTTGLEVRDFGLGLFMLFMINFSVGHQAPGFLADTWVVSDCWYINM